MIASIAIYLKKLVLKGKRRTNISIHLGLKGINSRSVKTVSNDLESEKMCGKDKSVTVKEGDLKISHKGFALIRLVS